MLQPRLTTCSECAEISELLCKIDCKLAKLGSILYGNLTLMLDTPFPADAMIDLLNYKRILTFKQVNADYCEDYTLDMIASKVRRLTAGAVCTPCECKEYTTTSTTTTAIPIVTTTTSALPVTTTTTTTALPTTTTTTTNQIIECLDGLIIETIYLHQAIDQAYLPEGYTHPCPNTIGYHQCNRAFFEVYGNGVYMADSLMNNVNGTGGSITYSGKETCRDYHNTPGALVGGTWLGSAYSRYSKTVLTQQQAIDIANAGGGGTTIDLSFLPAMITYSCSCDYSPTPHSDITWLRISNSDGEVLWNSCVQGDHIYTIDVCSPQ